jgi:hypothetical protein
VKRGTPCATRIELNCAPKSTTGGEPVPHHSTLVRVEFSFDHRLDEVFHIDIKKSQITPSLSASPVAQ